MTHVSIIGTGNMGGALDAVLTRGGVAHTLVAKGAALPADTDIVVLAVPYGAVADVLATYGDALTGKVVVDLTNPVDFETFDSLVVPADSSAAAEIAAALPGASVLKAFNTTFAGALAGGTVLENPTTVLVAGDDADAKALLADAVSAGGLTVVDAGSLKRARELEALGFLQITLAAAEKTSWATGFQLA
ncbi:NAD(P)-binding domain-containing protein [Actinotalea sp. M2MS4P-6]|uniref:NADPH-dependent F420 reductase n=1 Tax=Actinotalea sp. M2MS4P-6 TaxID=2983762 RepID=UPI0021E45A1D|nr:NAD(P)-binding domain-containing protein [Actinotalea sp. M2MS4P-6]MCV2394505.1 NAD(P)-binding domain-containing protein [Actinotalea sp. M2MS4P-6]